MQRVQMVGTQRSGSNLLRLMLDVQPTVFAPPSAHLLEVFHSSIGTYGPLDLISNRDALASDVMSLIARNVLSWPEGPPSLTASRLELSHSAVDLLFEVYDTAAKHAGSSTWVCKSLENLAHMDELLRADESMRFVHVLRDGRDVALSFANAPIGPKNPLVQARKWCREQQLIRRFSLANPTTVYCIRYEELVKSPQATIEGLFQWLGLPEPVDVTSFHESEMAARTVGLSNLWVNLVKPVNGDSVGVHRRPEHDAHVTAFETVAWSCLREFGYDCETYEDEDLDWEAAEADDLAGRDRVRRSADPAIEQLHGPYERLRHAIEQRTTESVGSPSSSVAK